MNDADYVVLVSSTSIPTKVATVISKKFNKDYTDYGEDALVEIQAIGPLAINKAVTSIVLARDFLASTDVNLICVPTFGKFKTKSGDIRNGIRFILRLEGR